MYNWMKKHLMKYIRDERAYGISEPIIYETGDNERIIRAVEMKGKIPDRTVKICKVAVLMAKRRNKTPIETLLDSCRINEAHAYDIMNELREYSKTGLN